MEKGNKKSRRGAPCSLRAVALALSCLVVLAFGLLYAGGANVQSGALDGDSPTGESQAEQSSGQHPGTLTQEQREAKYKAYLEGEGAAQDGAREETAATVYAPIVTSDSGARYRQGEVLAYVGEGADASALAERIAGVAYLADQSIAPEDIALGWVRLQLAEGEGVDEAAARLVEDGIAESAQRNFVYTLDSEAGTSNSQGDLQAGSISGLVDGENLLDASAPGSDSPSAEGNAGEASTKPERLGTGRDLASERYGENYDPQVNSQWEMYAIKADYAYKHIKDNLGEYNFSLDSCEGRPSVAIVDTGCFIEHEDLKDNIVDYYSVIGKTKENFWDIDGHGTNVAGCASAVTCNGVGVAGAGANSGLVPIRVFKYDGPELVADSADLVLAYGYILEHAAEDRIKVVNMSLGASYEDDELDLDDRATLDCIGKASKAGILTVVSAGNGGATGAYKDFPTYFDETGVGAIALRIVNGNFELGKADFSNYNKQGVKVEQLSAPGENLRTTASWVWDERRRRWLMKQNAYDDGLDGTSFAAPTLAGAAALVWAANPDLSVDEMKSVLFSTATDIVENSDQDFGNLHRPGFDLLTGFGCVNELEAVKGAGRYLKGGTSIAPGLTTTLTPYGGGLTSAEDGESELEWTWSSSDPAVATVDPHGMVNGLKAGSTVITATTGSGDDEVKIAQVVTVHGATVNGAVEIAMGKTTTYSIKEPLVSNGTWTWSTGNGNVATVNSLGVVTGRNPGTATITATLSTNPAVKASKNITVKRGYISSLSLSATSFAYNGKQQRPALTVRYAGGVVPAYGYKVSWPANTTSIGSKTVRVTGVGEFGGSASATYTIKLGQQAMYRLYNPYSGEHFYTANANERNNLVKLGWRYEGVGWNAPVNGTNVYRLYNRWSGDHHFTANASEKDACVRAGWTYEGVGWKSGGGKPVYREYNPFAKAHYHNYTASAAEHKKLCSMGWRSEGIGWYGM